MAAAAWLATVTACSNPGGEDRDRRRGRCRQQRGDADPGPAAPRRAPEVARAAAPPAQQRAPEAARAAVPPARAARRAAARAGWANPAPGPVLHRRQLLERRLGRRIRLLPERRQLSAPPPIPGCRSSSPTSRPTACCGSWTGTRPTTATTRRRSGARARRRPPPRTSPWPSSGRSISATAQGKTTGSTSRTRRSAAYWTPARQLVYEPLDPSLRVYLEWSNEVWNSSFPQNGYAETQGQSPETTGSDPAASYYVYQAVRLYEAFEAVFGKGSPRLVKVLSGSGPPAGRA